MPYSSMYLFFTILPTFSLNYPADGETSEEGTTILSAIGLQEQVETSNVSTTSDHGEAPRRSGYKGFAETKLKWVSEKQP